MTCLYVVRSLGVQGQSGLQSKFQDSQSYMKPYRETLSQKKKERKKTNKGTLPVLALGPEFASPLSKGKSHLRPLACNSSLWKAETGGSPGRAGLPVQWEGNGGEWPSRTRPAISGLHEHARVCALAHTGVYIPHTRVHTLKIWKIYCDISNLDAFDKDVQLFCWVEPSPASDLNYDWQHPDGMSELYGFHWIWNTLVFSYKY